MKGKVPADLIWSHPGPKKIYPDQEPSDGIAGTPMNARKNIHCESLNISPPIPC